MSSSLFPSSLRYFAGGDYGHFFRILPPFVNPTLAAGFTPMPIPTVSKWFTNFIALRHIWESPNFVWASFALILYFMFPYELNPQLTSASRPLTLRFFQERLPVWFTLTFGYCLFFYVTLYHLKWSARPFIQNRPLNYQKLAHDMFYTTCGVILWVAFENVFVYLWAHGALKYIPNSALYSLPGALCFVFGLVVMPLWREIHFYFCHRFLHYRPMFQQVHSLHHRNTDIEPFSGLAMHPMEHLYYYGCTLPNLLLYCSPFHLLWNGLHLLLSPAAGHSGWEDHFSGDDFHYMHHRYFECNYAGTGAAFLDGMFGTFQARFKEEDNEKVMARPDAKSTLMGLPTLQSAAYLLLSFGALAVWAVLANEHAANAKSKSENWSSLAMFAAVLAGTGPAVLAYIFAAASSGFQSFLEPFANRPYWQNVFHITIGTLFSIFPICLGCHMAFHAYTQQ